MKTKIISLCLVLIASICTIFASDISVGGIWYNFDTNSLTATVTHRGPDPLSYSNEYYGTVAIPSTVNYEGQTYSVSSIGDYAFSCCGGLKSIEIPNSITSIGSGAFSVCSGLTSVTLNSDAIVSQAYSSSSNFKSIFGSQVKQYIIGENITSIGNNAFYGCSNLTSVTLNSDAIVSQAYSSSSNFKSIFGAQVEQYILGENITSIGDYAFKGCSNLTSIKIPNNVTSIGNYAFSSCSGLTIVELPNSITSIGSSAFSDCYGLTSIEIPNSVTSIGNYAFYGSSLTSIKIPNGVIDIGKNTFCACGNLISVEIPNSVTSIGSGAFQGCRSLTSVGIPNSVISIGSEAFYGCIGLTSIEIPNSVTNIGNNAFRSCSSVTSVTIGNNVTTIGDYAFDDCIGLTSIEIPNSVTNIGNNAFRSCSSVTSITIGNNVTTIGDYAFDDCSSLTSMIVGSSVTNIGDSAFSDCNNLTSVTLNSDAIVSQTYSSNSNFKSIFGPQVEQYIIGENITSIGNNAFYGCNNLTSIKIPNSVKSIGSGVFHGCSSLTYVHISDIAAWCAISFENAYSNPLNYAHKLYLNDEQVVNLVIPNNVTSIGHYAFTGCRSLKSIIIPNSVKSIGGAAFEGCTGLTSVTIPNSVTSIGSDAFSGCESLTSITIGNSVTSIEDNAFYNCSSLHSVTIPNSVTSIGYMAFYGCDNLVSVIFGNNVGYIGQHAFERCENIKSIEIPNSVTSIGEYAFQLCSSLTSVSIGNSIKKIGEYAFDGCTGLTSVVIYAETPPTLDGYWGNWFDSRYLTSIYVPCGTSETYRTAAGWSNYASKIKEQSLPYTITTNALNGSISIDSICYDITLTVTPDEGYRFTQWSDGNKDNPRTFVLTQDTTFTAEFSNQFSINITCNEEYGTIVGENGMYDYLSEHTYEAVPNSGYHFTQWSDGNKDNPRTITLTQDTSLTAEFSNQYSINVSCNEEQGSINGENGMFDYLSEHTYEAVPNSGYYFVKWSDGNKDNPRTIVLTQDTSLTAIFDILYNVSVLSDDPTMGSASFSDLLETQSLNYGQYPIGTNLIAKAIPNQGYKFSHWSDGLSANPRGITVESDINLRAFFESETPAEETYYTISVSSNNTSMGTVSGGGTYEEGATATVTASPKNGYKFTKWSNGSTANPYSFTVTSNMSLTAYFEQSSTPEPENSKIWNMSDGAFNSLGTITSTKTVDGLTIYATSSKNVVIDGSNQEIDGLSFTHRLKLNGTGSSDARLLSFHVDGKCDIDVYLKSGSGSEDRTINVDKGSFGSSLTTIPALSTSISKGTIHYTGGATTIYLYSPSGGVNIYAIRVTSESTPQPTTYTVSVSSANTSMGTVSGGGTYEEGATATVTAFPKSGYKFTKWSNGSTANPYTFTVTSDVSLTAYFEQSSTPQPESSTFWNFSDAAFSSLGTITSTKTVQGLTLCATSDKNMVVDESTQEVDGISFTHRLKLNGTGDASYRSLKFNVTGDCTIDIYLKSGSSSADRLLNIDKGSFGNTYAQASAYGGAISKATVQYTGGATTIYVYSSSSGINLYGIRVTYKNTEDIENTVVRTATQKILRNGQILILRGDKTYTLQGQEVK